MPGPRRQEFLGRCGAGQGKAASVLSAPRSDTVWAPPKLHQTQPAAYTTLPAPVPPLPLQQGQAPPQFPGGSHTQDTELSPLEGVHCRCREGAPGCRRRQALSHQRHRKEAGGKVPPQLWFCTWLHWGSGRRVASSLGSTADSPSRWPGGDTGTPVSSPHR